MTENGVNGSICRYRPAGLEDLRAIYDIQNVPFRDAVFANNLPDFEFFEKSAKTALAEGHQKYYIFERDNAIAGYGSYTMMENSCEIVVWGRLLKTLIFASLKVAFDHLNVQFIQATVRTENKRMINACKYFLSRVVRKEMVPFQKGGFWGTVSMVGLTVFELTRDEFYEKEEMFRKQSMEVEIVSPN